MANYYVNNRQQSNGDHEVHVEGCRYFPNDRKYLGNFATCAPAVAEARKTHNRANGCATCSPSCHTT